MLKIMDSDQYGLPGTKNRFVHLCTLERQTGFGPIETYIYFHDRLTGKRYCEQLVGGHLEQIMNEPLIVEMERFLLEKGIAQTMIV